MGIRRTDSIRVIRRSGSTAAATKTRPDAESMVKLLPADIRKVKSAIQPGHARRCPEFAKPVERTDRIADNLESLPSGRRVLHGTGKGTYSVRVEELLELDYLGYESLGLSVEVMNPGDYSFWFYLRRGEKRENIGRLYLDHESGEPRLVEFYDGMNPVMHGMLSEIFRSSGRVRF